MWGHKERFEDAASRHRSVPTAFRVILLVRKVYAPNHPRRIHSEPSTFAKASSPGRLLPKEKCERRILDGKRVAEGWNDVAWCAGVSGALGILRAERRCHREGAAPHAPRG